jgi:hypothetical protein
MENFQIGKECVHPKSIFSYPGDAYKSVEATGEILLKYYQ